MEGSTSEATKLALRCSMGLGFKVEGLGLRVEGLGLRALGLGSRAWGMFRACPEHQTRNTCTLYPSS